MTSYTDKWNTAIVVNIILFIAILSNVMLYGLSREQPPHHLSKGIHPALLRKGDKVAIIAPAFTRSDIKERIEETTQVLHAWGLKVALGQHLYGKHGRFAGTDAQRRDDLQTALDDPSIKAIIAFRGGYGISRLIDDVDVAAVCKHPKWIVGFSDVTTLLHKLHQQGVVSIHGEMALHFALPAYRESIDSLHKLLFGGTAHLTAPAHLQNRVGKVTAPVVGGNLTTLCSHLGSDLALDTRGKILVIEDRGVMPYELDRLMLQLKRAGMLQHLAGLVVGSFVDVTPDHVFGNKSIEDIIKEHVSTHTYPVAFGLPVGHQAPNIAFPHGAEATLDVQDHQATLTFVCKQ